MPSMGTQEQSFSIYARFLCYVYQEKAAFRFSRYEEAG